jgi:putative sterol carrier protein
MTSRALAVPDTRDSFFDALSSGGPHSLLAKARGTVRFDVRDGDRIRRWLVELDRGDVTVSRRRGTADCVVRTNLAVFDDLVTGEVNALAAVLRGEVTIEGDPELLVLFQRVLPAPSRKGRK